MYINGSFFIFIFFGFRLRHTMKVSFSNYDIMAWFSLKNTSCCNIAGKKNVGSYLNNNLWSTWGKFLRPNLRNLSYRRIILEIIFICRLLKLQLIPDYIQCTRYCSTKFCEKKFFPVKMFNHACQCPTGWSYFLIFLLPSLNITNF